MEAVIAGVYGDGSVVYDDAAGGVEAVLFGFDGEGSAGDVDVSEFGVIGILGFDGTVGGIDGEGSVQDFQLVFGGDSVVCGCDVIGSSGDDEVIFGDDAVFVVCLDSQASCAVAGEVGLGEDDAVHGIVIDLGVFGSAAQGVFAALGEGDENFVGFADVDGGVCLAVDAGSIEDDLDFVGIGGVYDDLAVLEGSAYDVNALFCDGDGAAVHFCSITGYGGCGLIEGDFDGFGCFVGSALLTVGEIGVDGGFGQFQIEINIIG